MISKREKSKLKNGILYGLYGLYEETNILTIDSIALATCFKYNYDEHDISLALKSLKADGFIDVDFIGKDEWSDIITITQKGIDYCYNNRDNKFIKYLKQNHLAIIAIIVSIIALFY